LEVIPMSTRAHVVLPEDLIAQVDRITGRRRRSRFVEEAIREKLAREALSKALEETAGTIDPAEYPEWASPASTSEWVARRREADSDRSPIPADEGS
jgi:hypothetical protein